MFKGKMTRDLSHQKSHESLTETLLRNLNVLDNWKFKNRESYELNVTWGFNFGHFWSFLTDFLKILEWLRITQHRLYITLNFIWSSYSSSRELLTSYWPTSKNLLALSLVIFSKILKTLRIVQNHLYITLNIIRNIYSSSWKLLTRNCLTWIFSLVHA